MEEDPLLRTKTVYQHHDDHHRHSPGICVKLCALLLFAIFIVLFLFTLIISLISPILWAKLSVLIAQNALNGAVMTINTGLLLNPTATTVTLSSNVTISQTGAINGTLSEANLTTFYNGQPFGMLSLPNASFQGFAATTFIQTGVLEVHNPDVFRQQAADLVLGNSITWRLSGPITVSFKQLGLTLNLDLHIEKDIVLNGGAIQNAVADNLTVIAGYSDYLLGTIDQSMYNPSTIELTGLGTVVMYSFDTEGNHIAEATIENFSILSGWNYQKNVSVKTLLKKDDPVQNAAVKQYISNWAMGIDQTVVLKGPISVSSGANYLLNTTSLSAVVRGNRVPLVLDAYLISSGVFPSAMQKVRNPLGIGVTQTDFSFQVYMDLSDFPGASDYVGSVLTQSKQSCPSTNVGPLMKLVNSSIYLEPNSITEIDLTISLANIASPTFYCNLELLVASCCGLYQNKFSGVTIPSNMTNNPILKINSEGTFNVTIGEFNIVQYYATTGVPLSCFNYSSTVCASSTFKDICNPPYPGMYCPYPLINSIEEYGNKTLVNS